MGLYILYSLNDSKLHFLNEIRLNEYRRNVTRKTYIPLVSSRAGENHVAHT